MNYNNDEMMRMIIVIKMQEKEEKKLHIESWNARNAYTKFNSIFLTLTINVWHLYSNNNNIDNNNNIHTRIHT